jgi:hypothetical protein
MGKNSNGIPASVPYQQNCERGVVTNGVTQLHWQCLDVIKTLDPFFYYEFEGDNRFAINGISVQGRSINGTTYFAWADIPGLVPHREGSGWNFSYYADTALISLLARFPGEDFGNRYPVIYTRTFEERLNAIAIIENQENLFLAKKAKDGEPAAKKWVELLLTNLPDSMRIVRVGAGKVFSVGFLIEKFLEDGVSQEFAAEVAKEIIGFNPAVAAMVTTFEEFSIGLGGSGKRWVWRGEPYGSYHQVLKKGV